VVEGLKQRTKNGLFENNPFKQSFELSLFGGEYGNIKDWCVDEAEVRSSLWNLLKR